jgi:hypothetical protein
MHISNILFASLAFGLARASVIPEAKLMQVEARQNPPTVSRGNVQNCNTATNRACWMNGPLPPFNVDSDSEMVWPTTGKEVFYDLHITKKTLSPDGNAKPMLVIDGKYPGTLIKARKSHLPGRARGNLLILIRMGRSFDHHGAQ